MTPYRVLLVEDDHPLQDIIRDVLEQVGGYEVTATSDGNEAWDAYLKMKEGGRPPHVVYSDITPPYMDGIELAARMREEGIPVVLMTGDGDAAMYAARVRADLPLVQKPANIGDIIRAVDTARETLDTLAQDS